MRHLKLKDCSSLVSSLLVLLSFAQSASALDIPLDSTTCSSARTCIRPTPAERNSSIGFHWLLSYSNDVSAPKLVSRYYGWPTTTQPQATVYVLLNTTFGDDPSYILNFGMSPLWNASWREPPLSEAFTGRAYINVRLVTNVSRTTTASETALRLTYLLGTNGEPVSVTAAPSLNCNRFIKPDGTRNKYEGSWLQRHLVLFICLLCIPAILIFGALFLRFCVPWTRRWYRETQHDWYVRRKWRAWKRRQAVERFEQPTFVDDELGKPGMGVNWGASSTADLESASEAARPAGDPGAAHTPSSATPIPLQVLTAGAGAEASRTDSGQLPAGDAMEGHPKPPPAYTSTPSAS